MSHPQKPSNVAVVGVGRMGRHHARTYFQMPEANLVAVVDADETRRNTIAKDYGCKAYATTQQLLDVHRDLAGVTLAVPTTAHTDAATPFIERAIACLIEKPLATTSDEARALAQLAEKHGAILQVGHVERFNPIVRAVSALKLKPRWIEAHRISPMTFRSMDVSVVMDMLIHDLDIVLALVGRPLKRVEAVGAAILGESLDLCDARLTFEGGCVVSLRCSRMAMGTSRGLKLLSNDAYVTLDYADRTGTWVNVSDNQQTLDTKKSQLAQGEDLSAEDYLAMLKTRPLEIDLPPGEDDPLTAQARSFLSTIVSGGTPVVTAEHGCLAIDAAERIIEAAHTHNKRSLQSDRSASLPA